MAACAHHNCNHHRHTLVCAERRAVDCASGSYIRQPNKGRRMRAPARVRTIDRPAQARQRRAKICTRRRFAGVRPIFKCEFICFECGCYLARALVVRFVHPLEYIVWLAIDVDVFKCFEIVGTCSIPVSLRLDFAKCRTIINNNIRIIFS